MNVRDAIGAGIAHYRHKNGRGNSSTTVPGDLMVILESDPGGAYRDAVNEIDKMRDALEAKA